MNKYLLIAILPLLFWGCQETIQPAENQLAYFWIWNHGGICGCTTSQMFVDSEGRVVEIPSNNLKAFIFPEGEWRNAGEGRWTKEILQQNLNFAEVHSMTLEEGDFDYLKQCVPSDEGADLVTNDRPCADGAEMSFSALIKNENEDSYRLIFLGSENDCSGNQWEHRNRNGRMLVRDLKRYIFN